MRIPAGSLYFSHRNAIAINYVLSNNVVEGEIGDLVSKIAATGTYGPPGAIIQDIVTTIRDAWEANAEANSGHYWEAANNGTRIILEAFVKTFGDATVLAPYALDVAKITAAAGTAYTYGFFWGQ